MSIVYCKFNDEKSFHAYNLATGLQVSRLLFATIMDNTEENQKKLQKLAELNGDNGLTIQLRENGKVVFETK